MIFIYVSYSACEMVMLKIVVFSLVPITLYFYPEKLNIKVIGPGELELSGALLSAEKAKAKAEAEQAGMHLLRVPRRYDTCLAFTVIFE